MKIQSVAPLLLISVFASCAETSGNPDTKKIEKNCAKCESAEAKKDGPKPVEVDTGQGSSGKKPPLPLPQDGPLVEMQLVRIEGLLPPTTVGGWGWDPLSSTIEVRVLMTIVDANGKTLLDNKESFIIHYIIDSTEGYNNLFKVSWDFLDGAEKIKLGVGSVLSFVVEEYDGASNDEMGRCNAKIENRHTSLILEHGLIRTKWCDLEGETRGGLHVVLQKTVKN